MNYLCPKCKHVMMCMASTSIPAYITYKCVVCGYSSKIMRDETDTYTILPEWLREKEGKDEQA